MALKIGDKCPSFQLISQNGDLFDSKDYVGKKKLVIYFYPKDNTYGCTKQACSFRDNYEVFKEKGAEVIGISSDKPAKHESFIVSNQLPFILLSDEKNEVRKRFGVPSNLLGLIPGRVTYIIDKKGIIKGIYNSARDFSGHVDQALKVLDKMD